MQPPQTLIVAHSLAWGIPLVLTMAALGGQQIAAGPFYCGFCDNGWWGTFILLGSASPVPFESHRSLTACSAVPITIMTTIQDIIFIWLIFRVCTN